MYGDHLDIRARRLRSKILKRLARQGWGELNRIRRWVTLWFRRLRKCNNKRPTDSLVCTGRQAKNQSLDALGVSMLP